MANKAILDVVLDPPVGAETSLNLGNLSLIASSDALHRLAKNLSLKTCGYSRWTEVRHELIHGLVELIHINIFHIILLSLDL